MIENRRGAGGNLGAVEVARSQPDGYTVFYVTSAVAFAPAVYVKLGFRPDADFAPLSLTATIPLVLIVNSAVPANTASEFVDWVKAQGGKVNYSSSRRGALLAGACFLKEMGLDATRGPHRGSAAAITDLLSGSTQFMFLPINEARTHIEGGAMRALAVTHEQRLPQLPHVPTMKEVFGLATMNMGAWQSLLALVGAPAAITTILRGALEMTQRNEALRTRPVDVDRSCLAALRTNMPTTCARKVSAGPRPSKTPELSLNKFYQESSQENSREGNVHEHKVDKTGPDRQWFGSPVGCARNARVCRRAYA